MVTITLKNIPAPIHRALKQQARSNHRSLNGEVIACLEKLLMPQPIDRRALLERIRQHRAKIPAELDDKWLLWARNQGRP